MRGLEEGVKGEEWWCGGEGRREPELATGERKRRQLRCGEDVRMWRVGGAGCSCK